MYNSIPNHIKWHDRYTNLNKAYLSRLKFKFIKYSDANIVSGSYFESTCAVVMAQHDGSFLSVLSLDHSIEDGDLLDSSLNLSNSSSLDLLAESATQRLQSLHTNSDNRIFSNDTGTLTSAAG